MAFIDRFRELERRRWRERERKDREVEGHAGPRPLEGWSSGGHTTWASQQDDEAAPSEHGNDAEASERASEEQIS